jgi:quercetin dioxygenase-like cupin family protein
MSEKKVAKSLVVSRNAAENFVPGRRDFLRFRNLGAGDATEGAFGAVVIEAKSGMPEPTNWHYHECDWQNIFILRGWVSMEFLQGEAIEPVRVENGDFYMLRGGTVHRELATSDDMMALELTLPAKIETVAVDPPAAAKG